MPPSGVYDPEREQEERKRALPREDTPEFLRQREDLHNPDAKDNQAAGDSSDPRELKAKEDFSPQNQKDPDQVGKGHTGSGEETHSFRNALSTRKKKLIAGLALLGATVAVSIAIFLALLPLKILHIVTNLENRYFASSENAMSREADAVVSKYIKKYVYNGLANCKAHTTLNKECKAIVPGNGLFANLYRGWADGHLENNLATKYNMEFKRDASGSYYLKGPGMNDNGVNLAEFTGSSETFDEFIDKSPEFNRYGSRTEFRKAFKSNFKVAFKNESFYVRMMYRIKVGRLLEKKYGIRRCIIFCAITDKFSDWKDAKGNDVRKWAAQRLQAQRVLGPRVEMLGVIIECVFDSNCDPVNSPDSGTTPSTFSKDGCQTGCDVNGEPLSKEEKTAQQRIDNLVARYGNRQAVEDAYNKFAKKGFFAYILDEVVDKKIRQLLFDEGTVKTGGGEASRKLSDSLPYIGAVFKAETVLNFFTTGGPKLKKLSYVMNAASAVELFSLYRTYADETKSGRVDPTMVGSFTDSLGPGSHCNPSESKCDAAQGGTAEAEETPLYQAIIGGSATGPTKISNLLNPTAYAASPRYTCEDNGNKPPSGIICDVEKLNQSSKAQALLDSIGGNGFIKFLATYIGGPIRTLKNLITATIEILLKPLKPLLDIAIKALVSFLNSIGAKKLLTDMISSVSKLVLPLNPVSNNMSGGRTFDMVAAGASVSGNDYAHHGLGGVQLTNQQVVAILDEQSSQEQDRIKNESVFARMFDINNDGSLVNRIAMALPSSPVTALNNGFVAFISNPFSKILHSFGSMFGLRNVYAATSILGQGGAQGDIFGVTQYGYPVDDPIFKQDPEDYWNKYCSDPDGKMTLAWNKLAVANLNQTGGTYMPENPQGAKVNAPGADPKGTNPCLLLQAFATSAGALYTDKVLSPGDLSSTSSSSGTSTGASTSCNGGGQYSAVVGPGANFAGIDQGIDFTPSDSSGFDICTPASGTITLADQTGHQFDRTNGQAEVILQMDQAPNAPNSSNFIYFAEIIQINSNVKVGTHLNKGDVIGHNAENPGIETGWGVDAKHGFPCSVGGSTPCGESFNSWILAGGGS